jgi:nucleoside-diphosphate-sugar epimerase
VTAIVRNEESDIEDINSLPNVKIVYCTLAEIDKLPDKIGNEKHDVFFHLAWEGAGGKGRADYSLQLNNVKYTCDCAKIAKLLGCNKFLSSGTITEKIAEDILNIKAKAENTMYGICKHTTHCMLDVLCENIGIHYVWMRFSNVYGPRSINGNIVGYTISEFIRGNTPTFSKAEQPYDLIYIEDLVKAIYLIGKAQNTKNCYYIGSGSTRQLREYLLSIKEIYGKGCEISLGKRPEDNLQYNEEWFDIADLTKDVGFRCEYSFEDGIRKTIRWIEENINYVV